MGDLTVRQVVPAGASQVYAAFTSADGLARWWWPHIADSVYHVDAKVGGAYDIRSEAAGIGVRGVFLELDEPRRIRMTWNWIDRGVSEVEEQVEVAFVLEGKGTRVDLVHYLSPQSGDGQSLRQGWNDVLARLAGNFGGANRPLK